MRIWLETADIGWMKVKIGWKKRMYKANIRENREVIIGFLGEICWGLNIENFETKIGVKEEEAEALLERLLGQEKMGSEEASLSEMEIKIIKNAFREILNQIEEREFSTRCGFTIEEARQKIENIQQIPRQKNTNLDKQFLGKELRTQLEKGCDVVKLSRWAYKVYSENIRNLDDTSEEVLESLFVMEEGPEFELTKDRLLSMADRLIKEGENEELSPADVTKYEFAQKLDENWIMCPTCNEAWEGRFEHNLVCCPKCKNKLKNPFLNPL